MHSVESFQLDHTAVQAPYVRRAMTETHDGATISKYDVRLIQPNTTPLTTAAIHTLEHLLAIRLREEMDGVIDLSPMGCRTGFYLIAWGEAGTDEVAKALGRSLESLATVDRIPATTATECGNYQDHDLAAARDIARRVLEQGISSDAFERRPVSLA
ncbi:MAG: S-ribosylhomocysteine lyase [Bacillota bacterium]|nr:S-ribosylhomocysteine lyase [Bacillota bacterium]